MSESLPFILPENANVIEEWIVKEDEESITIAYPSWSVQGGAYYQRIDKKTRTFACECKKFLSGEVCHHLRGAKFAMIKPLKKRRKGMQETQLEAFFAFTPQELAHRQAEVYSILMDKGPLCIREIADGLHLPEHCITGRLMDVRNMGLVDDAGEKIDEVTGKRVILWGVT